MESLEDLVVDIEKQGNGVIMTMDTICGTDACETIGNAGRERALKIILTGK